MADNDNQKWVTRVALGLGVGGVIAVGANMTPPADKTEPAPMRQKAEPPLPRPDDENAHKRIVNLPVDFGKQAPTPGKR